MYSGHITMGWLIVNVEDVTNQLITIYGNLCKLKTMGELYNYIFHYNHYTELWNAIPREMYNKYWDNDDNESILKSKSITTLLELIGRGDEFVKAIK